MKFEEKTEDAEDEDGEDVVYETPDFAYLGDGGSPQLLTISRTMKAANLQLQRFDFEDSVVICLREAGIIDGSRTNACVSALVKGSGRFDWRVSVGCGFGYTPRYCPNRFSPRGRLLEVI